MVYLRDRARAMDAAVHALFLAFDSLRGVAAKLSSMGAGPSLNLVDVSCRRMLVAASIGTRLQLEPMLAPGERHTFDELAARWSETVGSFAGPRLNNAKKGAA